MVTQVGLLRYEKININGEEYIKVQDAKRLAKYLIIQEIGRVTDNFLEEVFEMKNVGKYEER